MILDSLEYISRKVYTKWEKNFSSALYYHIDSKLNNYMDRNFWVWAENKVWVAGITSVNNLYIP